MVDNVVKHNVLVFVTCCLDAWGGSEELWSRSLPFLQDDYDKVIVFKNKHDRSSYPVRRILEMGVILEDLSPSYRVASRIKRQCLLLVNRIKNRNYHQGDNHYLVQNFKKRVQKIRPRIVVISQGINFDGLNYAQECLKLHIPYVIVSQKAVEFYWPHFSDKSWMQKILRQSLANYFVSYHNLRLTEDQFGMKLTNSSVVFNPIKVKKKIIQYPPTSTGYRLACVGRFFLIDKGQDILIKILTQRKWRDRPITVSFVGSGPDLIHLQEMIALHGLENINIIQFQSDIEKLWLNFHALILPSRSEGLPLALAEAMALGRMAIVSNAGGNAEFVEEGVSGFIGETNASSLDDALERAWMRRHEWQELGKNAHSFIKDYVPPLPEKNFAELLKQLIDEKPTTSVRNYSYV